jgi:hypothetical protein
MKKFYFLTGFLLLNIILIKAQCNESLLEKAKKEMSDKEELLKDYAVKLNAATIDQPAPVAKFSQILEQGKTYRIRIFDDKEEFVAKAILRLFDGKMLIGNSYSDKLKKSFKFFDFQCQKTISYDLLITFQDGKAGCAVILLAALKK